MAIRTVDGVQLFDLFLINQITVLIRVLILCLEFASNAGEAFASLTDLVEHYMEHKDLLVTNEGVKLQLKFPYRQTGNDPTQERWYVIGLQRCSDQRSSSAFRYHGNLTGHAAESLLSNQDLQDGAFLVRDSRSEAGSFAFSVKHNNKDTDCKLWIGNKTCSGAFYKCNVQLHSNETAYF